MPCSACGDTDIPDGVTCIPCLIAMREKKKESLKESEPWKPRPDRPS